MNLPKYSLCKHCERSIEKHHYRQHERKCFMSYNNLVLIASYFLKSVSQPNLLKRKKFHHFCVDDAQILSPVSMGNYFNQNQFKMLVLQLLILLYRNSLFDWEYAEILIHHLTNGSFI